MDGRSRSRTRIRIEDIPHRALIADPTHIPTRVAYDWRHLLNHIETNGYAIIECAEDELKVNWSGTDTNPRVKAFNAWLYSKSKRCIRSRRIGKTRWFVCL